VEIRAMKFTTLRNVTLALLFALLADTVYAGSSGPTPAQRENRRDNNDDQEQQGRPTPRGGVQVLPQEHGGVDLNQFNRRPGNPQNPNERGVAPRNNQVGGPAIPTDGDPAAGPVPNAGPATENTTSPAAQPNQPNQTNVQPNVRQRQQQLGLEQILGQNRPAQPPQLRDANQPAPPNTPRGPGAGNQRTTPQNLQDRNRTNVAPGANQWQGQQQRILQLPNANQRPVQPPQGGGQFGQGLGNPQNPNEANADTRNNPVGGPAVQPNQRNVQRLPNANQPAAPPNLSASIAPTRQPNATPAQVSTDIFDPYTKPTIQYEGDVLFDNNQPYLAAEGTLNGRPVGKYLAGGATSRVHESLDPKLVKKIISLNRPRRSREEAGATITEQNVGRTILQGLQVTTQSTLFRVVERREQAVISAKDKKGKEYHFVFNREENIASVVYADRDNPKSPVQIVDSLTKMPITASNAEDRAKLRDNTKEKEKRSPLTDLEELTINLVIRTLNDHGLVWTDHKLANLDIVRNEDSPTGYQVIFFDFDGFRQVKGDGSPRESQRQAEAAREIQKAFDNPALPNQAIPFDKGWRMMYDRVIKAYRTHYPDEYQEAERQAGLQKDDRVKENILLTAGFDLSVFAGQPVTTLASPPANLNRGNYLLFNSLNEQDFKTKVDEISQQHKLKIEFDPKNPIKPKIFTIQDNTQP
jgi:hypothetical protein